MAWENDLLERKQVAEFIQKLLEGEDSIKVMNIDSPWGTGKTFFLENWQEDLRGNRGVVYFNAWKRDYTGDPFISLVSSIKSQLEDQVSDEAALTRKFGDFSKSASSAILSASPVVLKAIAKGLVRKFVGVDVEEVADSVQEEKGGGSETGEKLSDEVIDSAKGVADEAAIKAVQALIESSDSSSQAVDEFRRVFEGLVKEVGKNLSSSENPEPVYIFIDELDRCRPTYAIELLERVKHFLDVPGCKFVIATDTKQLGHSVRAVYGGGFNSAGYLKRFFDLTYSLDYLNIKNFIKAKPGFDYSGDMYCLEFDVKSPNSIHAQWYQDTNGPVAPDSKTIIA